MLVYIQSDMLRKHAGVSLGFSSKEDRMKRDGAAQEGKEIRFSDLCWVNGLFVAYWENEFFY